MSKPQPRPPSIKKKKSKEDVIKEFLLEYHWPVGLQNRLIKSLKEVSFRYILCDNSIGMMIPDACIMDSETNLM